MQRKKALTHLQVILLIDLIVVASAAGGYFYLESIPAPPMDPSLVQLGELVLTQTEYLEGQTTTASINVTNIGTETGSYTAKLLIDGQPNQESTFEIDSSATKAVEFEISNIAAGAHIARIGNSETPFTVLSIFAITDLAINRTEAKIGEAIGISVKVTSRAETTSEYSVPLTVNNAVVETKTGTLNAAASTSVLFEVVEQEEGTYIFQVGSLNGTFKINPLAPPPRPAEFNITDLTFDPDVSEPGKPVSISANVTNVGELSGSISLDLTINGAVRASETVELSGGEGTRLVFNVTETELGNYTVQLGNLTGQFSVQQPSRITLSSMFVRPYEVWTGDIVNVVVTATNPDATASSLSVRLFVDNLPVESKTVTLEGGASTTVQFETVAGAEGSHKIRVNDVGGGGFKVVKTGWHTLSVSSSPVTGADVTINGVPHKTFYSELLEAGKSYTITVPATDPTGRFSFQSWDDGVSSPTRTVVLNAQTSLSASFTGGSSCPSMYYWNGTHYLYAGDVSNHGWLGYINYINEDGSLVYYRNNPWDYIKLDRTQLAATNGAYNVSLIQKFNEIFYLDQAYMVVVDHPANLDVYSTMVEEYLNPNYMGKIYTVGTSPQLPVSAVNEKGQNVLSHISKMDNVFTPGVNGLLSSTWNDISWGQVTLNLGNLAGAKQIKVIVRAIVDWGNPEDYTNWLNQFFYALPNVPNGTQITPPPFMEVKDANGNWIRVPQSRDFPLPADSLARTYVIDLTGLFPTNDYSLRINNFWNVTFDYIAVDTSPQQQVTIQRIDPHAYLYQDFESPSNSSGSFTRYGDVTPLVLTEDDMFVIGRQGDGVSLLFPIGDLKPVAPGMVRDFFIYESCWFKDENGNWGFGFGFTSDPLPFRTMSGFPYMPWESYPTDAAHNQYITDYNTRLVPPKVTP